MPLFTPERKLQECDSVFTEISEQFAKKVKGLIDAWTYIHKVSCLIDDQQAVLDDFATCLNNRRNMLPTANELMEEINRIEKLCDRSQALLTSLDETVVKFQLREEARKRKERINSIAMTVACVVLGGLFIFGYITFRIMAG